ncbi:hypothetical protein Tco_0754066 [Tanacetum coccineum]
MSLAGFRIAEIDWKVEEIEDKDKHSSRARIFVTTKDVIRDERMPEATYQRLLDKWRSRKADRRNKEEIIIYVSATKEAISARLNDRMGRQAIPVLLCVASQTAGKGIHRHHVWCVYCNYGSAVKALLSKSISAAGGCYVEHLIERWKDIDIQIPAREKSIKGQLLAIFIVGDDEESSRTHESQ